MSATHFSGPVVSTAGFQPGASSYESLDAAKTLVAADSGKTFGLNAAVVYAITLPASTSISAGWSVRVCVETTFITSYWFISKETGTDSDIIISQVNVLETDTGKDGPSSTGHTTITFELGAEQVGDYVDIQFNGTNFYAVGQNALAGGITLA